MSKIFNLRGKAGDIFRDILEHTLAPQDTSPNDFICQAWKIYEGLPERTQAITGRLFEYLVAHLLWAQGIRPIFFQAQFYQVPNAVFDLVLYDERQPVALTLKTTLRERYKQADLEGVALKQVYRNAQCVLITLSNEGDNITRKIENLEVTGIDRVVVIERGRDEMDRLVADLQKRTFTKPEKITPMVSADVFM